MAKFIVTSSSHFKPLDYDDMVKPLAQMTEAHNAAADAYDQLSMETAALQNYISTDGKDDEQARAMYQGYVDKLNRLQNNLWDNGYNAQTRRDLNSARSAYASDITRLQKAIQTRQERSKEYWAMANKSGDMVMGHDPAKSGLDNYLNDENYGYGWFAYSGDQFMGEVAEDAKNRAKELLQMPEVIRDPRLVGYLTEIVQHGYTGAQVSAATDLAYSALKSGARSVGNDSAEGILANVLLSHLDASGATQAALDGRLDASEVLRLFGYGARGLASAIGETKPQNLNDKVWDEAMAMRRIAAQKATAAAPAEVPHRELVHRQVISPGADKARNRLHEAYDDKTYENGPILVNMPGGGGRQIANASEAEELFQTERTRKFLEATGIDVRKDASNWWRTTDSKQTGSYQGVPLVVEHASVGQRTKHNLKTGDAVVKKKVGNKWVYDAEMTDRYNTALHDYNDWMDSLSKANPSLKIDTLGLTPKENQELRRKYDIPASVPDSDLRYAIASKYDLEESVGVPIVSGPVDDDFKKIIAENINGVYANTHSDKDWKTSRNGFYRVGENNSGSAKTNEASGKGSLSSVFTTEKDGTIKPDSIYKVYVLPKDVRNGVRNVRLETSQGTFTTDVSTLGYDIENALNGTAAQWLEQMMLPINQATNVFDTKSPVGKDLDAWNFNAISFYNSGYDIPLVNDGGVIRPATPVEIARSSNMQEVLLDGINQYLRKVISNGMDPISVNPRQHKSYTSSKATGTSED